MEIKFKNWIDFMYLETDDLITRLSVLLDLPIKHVEELPISEINKITQDLNRDFTLRDNTYKLPTDYNKVKFSKFADSQHFSKNKMYLHEFACFIYEYKDEQDLNNFVQTIGDEDFKKWVYLYNSHQKKKIGYSSDFPLSLKYLQIMKMIVSARFLQTLKVRYERSGVGMRLLRVLVRHLQSFNIYLIRKLIQS